MLNDEQRTILHDVARRSIIAGLEDRQISLDPDEYDAALREDAATFVTLEIEGQLRGCIGMLEAMRPLIEDVAQNAYAAAFKDPRFPPLRSEELPRLDIHISILQQPEPMQFDSEQDLLEQLRPGIDGLVIHDGPRRATFLPSVWDSLEDKVSFLHHLKQKAGLAPDHWSDGFRVERYEVEEF